MSLTIEMNVRTKAKGKRANFCFVLKSKKACKSKRTFQNQ